MRTLLETSLAVAVGMVLAAAAAGAAAPPRDEAADDPFYKGLQQRGLKSLTDQYLKEKKAAPPTPVGGEKIPEGSKLALAILEARKAELARTFGERDAGFKKACGFYGDAIAEMQADLAKVPPEKWKDKADLRLRIVQTRMAVGNMIFQTWLRNDLDLLEVSDRRAGDRHRATEHLKEAKNQFSGAFQEISQWLSEIDRLQGADRDKIVNAGYESKLRGLRREAEYNDAWLRYYYAWVLPKDYKPPQGERPRQDLLKDAITTFEGYTRLPDRVTAKWFAYLVIGLAHRELGEYNDAVSALNEAGGAKSAGPESLKIRVIFEQALTLLRKGDSKGARAVIDSGRGLFGEAKIKDNTYGQALPLLEGESYILEAKAQSDEALKQKGVEIFQAINTRGGPWTLAVGGVLTELVGATGKPEEMEPILVWNLANKTLEEAQKTNDKTKYEQTAELYRQYTLKVKPEDPNYVDALYSQGGCLVKLDRGADAIAIFRDVADKHAAYKYAKNAAQIVVNIAGKIYEQTPTEENRQKYEEALAWFIGKYLEVDPEQVYFYALILNTGKKYTLASEQFRKVPPASEHYPDARYWIPLCRLENFRDKTLATRDPKLILPEARDVAQELRNFTAFSQTVKAAQDKQKTVRDWGMTALITAADVYLYPEVGMGRDALTVLDQVEKDYAIPEGMRGRLLKLRIEANQKLGQFDQAQKALDSFLSVAKPEDVGPVLRGLFQAVVEDVRRLMTTDKKAAAQKVEGAEKLGDQFRKWLDAHGGKDKAEQIENVRYDVAELYLASEDYERALAQYREIVGDAFPPPEPLKAEGVFGLARSYQALADKALDFKQAEPVYTKAFNYWKLLLDAEAGRGREKDVQRIWLYRYNLFYCMFKLGKKDDVKGALKALKIFVQPEPLGGKEPLLQRKFMELVTAVSD